MYGRRNTIAFFLVIVYVNPYISGVYSSNLKFHGVPMSLMPNNIKEKIKEPIFSVSEEKTLVTREPHFIKRECITVHQDFAQIKNTCPETPCGTGTPHAINPGFLRGTYYVCIPESDKFDSYASPIKLKSFSKAITFARAFDVVVPSAFQEGVFMVIQTPDGKKAIYTQACASISHPDAVIQNSMEVRDKRKVCFKYPAEALNNMCNFTESRIADVDENTIKQFMQDVDWWYTWGHQAAISFKPAFKNPNYNIPQCEADTIVMILNENYALSRSQGVRPLKFCQMKTALFTTECFDIQQLATPWYDDVINGVVWALHHLLVDVVEPLFREVFKILKLLIGEILNELLSPSNVQYIADAVYVIVKLFSTIFARLAIGLIMPAFQSVIGTLFVLAVTIVVWRKMTKFVLN